MKNIDIQSWAYSVKFLYYHRSDLHFQTDVSHFVPLSLQIKQRNQTYYQPVMSVFEPEMPENSFEWFNIHLTDRSLPIFYPNYFEPNDVDVVLRETVDLIKFREQFPNKWQKNEGIIRLSLDERAFKEATRNNERSLEWIQFIKDRGKQVQVKYTTFDS